MSNKYQEALDCIINWTRPSERTMLEEDFETLQELVDKEKPMKPSMVWEHADPKTRCKCSAGVIPANNYCWNCGQKLDWSDRNGYKNVI